MNIRAIGFFLGHILRLEALFMLPAMGLSFFYGETVAAQAFFLTILVIGVFSGLLILQRPRDMRIHSKEGFVTVALSWVVISIMGALPFWLSGNIPSFVDAFFETVSGFTTTGASILTDVEALPKGLLYWRSFTHWLGGMGVLVFMLAVVPMSTGNGDSLHLLRAESPGPVVGKLAPKMYRSARILYTIYVAMTLIEIFLLLLGGMPLFDSITVSFGTAGTGGFAITNTSIAAYPSYYLQGVIAVFMALFGVNFGIYYLILAGDFRQALRSEELRTYWGIMLISTLLIAFNSASHFPTLFDAFHHSFFQVSSIMTTTGFATADFNLWPEFSRYLLVLLMVLGASAGSTGGGIKTARVVILWKAAKNGIQKMLHPRSVRVIKMEGKVVEDQVVAGVNVFMTAYCIIAAVSMGLVALDNFSMETTITSVLACLNNIGPGLDLVGPTGNYSALSDMSKLVLSLDMLAGRLEIFPLLLLFAPSVWKRGR